LSTFFIGQIIHKLDEANAFLNKRSISELRAIRSVYLQYCRCSKGTTANIFAVLDTMPQLRTLQIRHKYYRSLVRVSGNELCVSIQAVFRAKQSTRMHILYLADLKHDLLAWKSNAIISMTMVRKHPDGVRW
jgi:hypothetical protein